MIAEQATAADVLNLWKSLEAAKKWGEPLVVRQCVARPEIVMVFGSGHELFELVHVADERVIDEDEFPSSSIERFNWKDLS